MTDEEYKVGYGKPPLHTRFGQPGSNPMGVTRENQEKRRANAEKATRAREMMLDALLEVMEKATPEQRVEMIDAAKNVMLKDTENRGLGMPKQQIDSTSSDGSVAPAKIIVQGVKPKGEEGE